MWVSYISKGITVKPARLGIIAKQFIFETASFVYHLNVFRTNRSRCKNFAQLNKVTKHKFAGRMLQYACCNHNNVILNEKEIKSWSGHPRFKTNVESRQ